MIREHQLFYHSQENIATIRFIDAVSLQPVKVITQLNQKIKGSLLIPNLSDDEAKIMDFKVYVHRKIASGINLLSKSLQVYNEENE